MNSSKTNNDLPAGVPECFAWYPRNLLADVGTPEKRTALIEELWTHDVKAETKLWPDGKIPLKDNDRPLKFVEGELWQRNLVVTDINEPFFVFRSANGVKNAPVAVVLPGGGYSVLGWNKEGTEIADWLNANGYSAAILLYRAPDQREAALCDVQRTIRILRGNAGKYGVNPDAIGVIGFSAGANLAVAAATNWRRRVYEPVDALDRISARPDFQLPIYLWDVLPRDSSADGIMPKLAKGVRPALRAEFPVDAETPPAFIAQSQDDFCQIETSVYYYLSLREAGVKSELHVFPSGGHGYGARQVGNPTDAWPELAAKWLRGLNA